MIEFNAEVIKVESKKLISNDIEYSVKLITNEQSVLELAKLPAEQMIKVKIENTNG